MAPVRTGSAIAHTLAGASSSIVFAHTVGSGNNQVMYAAFMCGTPTVPTTATYNSVAMTLIDQHFVGRNNISVYRLIDPPTGTYNVSFSWTGKPEVTIISVTYKDVEVTAPNLASNKVSGSGAGSTPSVTVTSTITSTILDFAMCARFAAPLTFPADGAGQTRIQETTGVSLDNYFEDYVASEKAGAASTALTHTLSTTGADTAWAQIAYSISPKSATTQNGFFFV